MVWLIEGWARDIHRELYADAVDELYVLAMSFFFLDVVRLNGCKTLRSRAHRVGSAINSSNMCLASFFITI